MVGATSPEYVAIEIRLQYDDAKASCESHGAFLASVNSFAEQQYLEISINKYVPLSV